MRYVLYRMPVEPTDENSPIAMNDILGMGEYISPRSAMRYLRPRVIGRCVNDSEPTTWLGLYVMPQRGGMVLAHKERV